MHDDLALFPSVDFNKIRQSIIEKYDQPSSVSICHYVLKFNKVITFNPRLLINFSLN